MSYWIIIKGIILSKSSCSWMHYKDLSTIGIYCRINIYQTASCDKIYEFIHLEQLHFQHKCVEWWLMVQWLWNYWKVVVTWCCLDCLLAWKIKDFSLILMALFKCDCFVIILFMYIYFKLIKSDTKILCNVIYNVLDFFFSISIHQHFVFSEKVFASTFIISC